MVVVRRILSIALEGEQIRMSSVEMAALMVLPEGMAKSGGLIVSLRSKGRCNVLAGRDCVLLEGVTEEVRFSVVVPPGPAQRNETEDPRRCEITVSWPIDGAQSLESKISGFSGFVALP